jgi:hypothetical protein
VRSCRRRFLCGCSDRGQLRDEVNHSRLGRFARDRDKFSRDDGPNLGTIDDLIAVQSVSDFSYGLLDKWRVAQLRQQFGSAMLKRIPFGITFGKADVLLHDRIVSLCPCPVPEAELLFHDPGNL